MLIEPPTPRVPRPYLDDSAAAATMGDAVGLETYEIDPNEEITKRDLDEEVPF